MTLSKWMDKTTWVRQLLVSCKWFCNNQLCSYKSSLRNLSYWCKKEKTETRRSHRYVNLLNLFPYKLRALNSHIKQMIEASPNHKTRVTWIAVLTFTHKNKFLKLFKHFAPNACHYILLLPTMHGFY